MSNVTPINRHQWAIAEGRGTGQLTSAHRCALVRIQELAIEVSLHAEHFVTYTYHGHTHEISVSITPYAHAEAGNYRAKWAEHLYLPPAPNAEPDSLKRLGAIIVRLESLPLQPPAGGAA